MMMFLVSTPGSVVRKSVASGIVDDGIVVWDRVAHQIAGLRNIHTDHSLGERAAFEAELVRLVGIHKPRLLVSFLTRIVSADFLAQVQVPVVNFHPSVLPSYPGLHAVREQMATGETRKKVGATVHFIDAGVDTGAVILQSERTVEIGSEGELKGEIFKHQLLLMAHLAANAGKVAAPGLMPPLMDSAVDNLLGLRVRHPEGFSLEKGLAVCTESNWRSL